VVLPKNPLLKILLPNSVGLDPTKVRRFAVILPKDIVSWATHVDSHIHPSHNNPMDLVMVRLLLNKVGVLLTIPGVKALRPNIHLLPQIIRTLLMDLLLRRVRMFVLLPLHLSMFTIPMEQPLRTLGEILESVNHPASALGVIIVLADMVIQALEGTKLQDGKVPLRAVTGQRGFVV